MTTEKAIKFGWLLPVYFFYLVHLVVSDLEAGSCSTTCQNNTEAQNVTSSNRLLISNRCSCTLSCKVYDDCCYDSQFRDAAHNISSITTCLPLLYRGEIKAVARCSRSWSRSSYLCRKISRLFPPVTSKSTGVTYRNIHCATCNNDRNDLIIWNVTLKCCPEHDNATENILRRRYVYQDGYLQSVVSRTDNSVDRCMCKYHAREENDSFMDLLELRTCNSNSAISRCSSSWTNETIADLCRSFTEPVYARHKIYRNLYCAQCNYENLNLVLCISDILKKMVEEGADDSTLYNFCLQNNLQDCLQLFGVMGRGRLFAFRDLFNIHVRECIFPNCCDGYRPDYRTKSCRQLVRL